MDLLGGNPYSKASKSLLGLSFEGLCQTPLLLSRTRIQTTRAYRRPSIGIPSISISVPFESDSKTHDTSSVHTLTQCSDTAEDLATVQVYYDEAYILGSKATI